MMKKPQVSGNLQEVVISADSHVMEPPELWAKRIKGCHPPAGAAIIV